MREQTSLPFAGQFAWHLLVDEIKDALFRAERLLEQAQKEGDSSLSLGGIACRSASSLPTTGPESITEFVSTAY